MTRTVWEWYKTGLQLDVELRRRAVSRYLCVLAGRLAPLDLTVKEL